MHSFSKYFENISCSFIRNDDPIRSQFCTCHDSSAVVACINLWPHWIIRIKMKLKRIFTRFELWAHGPYVKQVPGLGSSPQQVFLPAFLYQVSMGVLQIRSGGPEVHYVHHNYVCRHHRNGRRCNRGTCTWELIHRKKNLSLFGEVVHSTLTEISVKWPCTVQFWYIALQQCILNGVVKRQTFVGWCCVIHCKIAW